jgi:hypothetical protein
MARLHMICLLWFTGINWASSYFLFFARSFWRVVHCTFNVSVSKNVTNALDNWLNGIDKKIKAQTYVGVFAVGWAIWIFGNDIIFNKADVPSFLHLIYKATYWIHTWFFFSCEPAGSFEYCYRLMAVVQDLQPGGSLLNYTMHRSFLYALFR